MRTVDLARQENLCISCGVCKNLCPAGCISWQRRTGLYSPLVDTEKCIGCGICAQVCPGLSEEYELKKDLIDTVMGNVSAAYNAWSKDAVIRHVSGSGGVVSTLISTLLKKNIYDSAFCVDSYDYHEQLRTNMVCAEEIPSDWENSTTPKSRYLPVSHENAIAYIKENPGKRIIFIGTSCAVRAIRKALRFCHADPENYLFIGLFCDKVFNYCITDYIQNELCQGKQLSQLHFKNKESGGWPGNMKLFFSDGSYTFLDKEERSKVKDYFMPERCLYCADKLNVNADISVGDNYTDQDSSPLGSNSVLIRTEAGAHAWARANNELVFNAFEKEKLISETGFCQKDNWERGFAAERAFRIDDGQPVGL